jgi:GNAT superfamily N-acetyltransferase
VFRRPLPPGYRVETFGPDHKRLQFSCGVPDLDAYLKHRAGQDQRRNLAAVFVLTSDGESVAGFFTLSAHAILPEDLPQDVSRKLPRHPIPVTLLGGMAVDQSLRGRGFGDFLLMHALERAWLGSREIASWAVVLDAKPGARDFYLKYDFIPFPVRPERLFLTMKTIEAIFQP